MVNQRYGLRSRTVRRGVRILSHGDGIAAAGAVFDGGIDTVIGRAAANHELVDLMLAQYLLKTRFIERIAGGFGDIEGVCGGFQIRQQRKACTPLFQTAVLGMLNKNHAIRGANQTVNMRDAAFALNTRRRKDAILHIYYHHHSLSRHVSLSSPDTSNAHHTRPPEKADIRKHKKVLFTHGYVFLLNIVVIPLRSAALRSINMPYISSYHYGYPS